MVFLLSKLLPLPLLPLGLSLILLFVGLIGSVRPVALLFHQVGAGGCIDLSLQCSPLDRPPKIPVDSKEQRINSPMITRLDISEFPP